MLVLLPTLANVPGGREDELLREDGFARMKLTKVLYMPLVCFPLVTASCSRDLWVLLKSAIVPAQELGDETDQARSLKWLQMEVLRQSFDLFRPDALVESHVGRRAPA